MGGEVHAHIEGVAPRDGAVGALIEGGADVNARSKLGYTPLMFAARSGNAESARLLVSAKADINATVPDLMKDAADVEWRLGAGEFGRRRSRDGRARSPVAKEPSVDAN